MAHNQQLHPNAGTQTVSTDQHEEKKMDTSLLEAQAYTNAVSRLNVPGPGYGYGYGAYGGGIPTDNNARAVLNAKLDAGIESIQSTQKLQLDAIVQQAAADRAATSEFRSIDQFNAINSNLIAQFNQVDRRFSDLAMQNQECCCELKAGQATLIAKIEAQDAVKAAEDRTRADAKLDTILAGI